MGAELVRGGDWVNAKSAKAQRRKGRGDLAADAHSPAEPERNYLNRRQQRQRRKKQANAVSRNQRKKEPRNTQDRHAEEKLLKVVCDTDF
jgi:hypothetical protein